MIACPHVANLWPAHLEISCVLCFSSCDISPLAGLGAVRQQLDKKFKSQKAPKRQANHSMAKAHMHIQARCFQCTSTQRPSKSADDSSIKSANIARQNALWTPSPAECFQILPAHLPKVGSGVLEMECGQPLGLPKSSAAGINCRRA